ncbi:phage tail tape measure protein [Cellulomonas soli]|uniref:phage tail tape measure protein n=1 Tax=Cellulomonas soli TaxID=931535 RepID=UPI003F86C991
MSTRNRNVGVNVTSQFDGTGFKSAEESAKVLERELNKLEQQQRRQVNMQTQAAAEMAAAEAKKAAAVVEANRAQADAMESFGRKTLVASATIAVGLGLSAKSAIDWESAWAGVTKTVDGSPEQMAALEESLRGLATTLPATHEEIAAVAEAAGQLGVKRQDVTQFTKTMIDLGETTNLSADEAATSLAQLANIMGTTAGESDQVGASLVALGNAGASTEKDIVSMGLRIAGAGRQASMSTADVLGIASALSSVGIEAEAGGSAVSRVITNINSDVISGKGHLETFARVAGVSAADFRTSWQRDAAGTLVTFIEGLGKMQAQGQDTNTVLSELGLTDLRVADALRRASSAGDLLNESIAVGNEAFAENNALVDEANKRYATTEARLQMARNQINDAAIDIGGNFLPALADSADMVGSLAAGFGALTPTQQSWVAGLGAAAAGLSALVGGAAIVIPKLAELSTTIDTLRGGSSLLGKAVGGAATALSGPWGLALAGATIAAGAWLTAQGKASQASKEFQATLDQTTAKLTEQSRALIYDRLMQSDRADTILATASSLGLGMREVVDIAIDPMSSAAKSLNHQLDENRKYLESLGNTNATYSEKADTTRQQTENINDLFGELSGTTRGVAADQEALREKIAAVGPVAEDAAVSADGYESSLSAVEVSAQDAETALQELSQMLSDLNSPTLDAREAERRFQEAIDAVTASIEENGTSLDISTEKGRANQATLDAMAQAGVRRADSLLQQTGSEAEFRASLDSSRQSLHDAAIAFGMSEDAAWAYVDEVLKVPDKVETQAKFDAVTADQQMQDFLARWQGKTVTVKAIMDSTGVDRSMAAMGARYTAQALAAANRADGAVVDYFVDGGIRESHVAEIAPAGQTRIWNEPETEGEAYIPLARSKRERSEAILEDVAGRFGMYVGRFANGAVLGGPSTGSPSTSSRPRITGIENYGVIQTVDVDDLVRKTTAKQLDAVRMHGLDGAGGML